MEKEFIPYEQALALKELGFDEPCFGYYVGKDKEVYMSNETLSSPFQFRLESKTTFVAPTFSQAFRWFREKYGLVHCIEPHFSSGFNIYIKDIKNDKPYLVVYKTYEEAELECLKKLIEIAQK